jgi:hypothetical protein
LGRYYLGGLNLETAYDWVTVAIFAGLVVLLLQRSTLDEPPDSLYHYAPPSIGCAIANYVGNEGYDIAAYALIAAIVGYIVFVLKPFDGLGDNAD